MLLIVSVVAFLGFLTWMVHDFPSQCQMDQSWAASDAGDIEACQRTAGCVVSFNAVSSLEQARSRVAVDCKP